VCSTRRPPPLHAARAACHCSTAMTPTTLSLLRVRAEAAITSSSLPPPSTVPLLERRPRMPGVGAEGCRRWDRGRQIWGRGASGVGAEGHRRWGRRRAHRDAGCQ
jgi:hypothetical protein